MEKKKNWLGKPESFKSELLRVETQAHRLMCVGPRQTKGGHHYNPAIRQRLEIRTNIF